MTRHHLKCVYQNEMLRTFVYLMVFIVLLLVSCAGSDTRPEARLSQLNLPPPAPAAEEKTSTLNAELTRRSAQLKGASSISDYRIGPEDLLEITVFQVEALKTTVRVSSSGYIKLSLTDKIYVTGTTVSELESRIASELEKFIVQPMVSIFVREYRSQQISVLGAVKDPRVFFVSGQKYLLDMISVAGGLAPEAGSICIIQTTIAGKAGENEQMEKIVIDLDDILIHGRAELNIPVYAGDIVQVPRSGIFFVDGAVNSPGEFHLKNKTTLTQALSMAKGLRYEASHSDIRIYRSNGGAERDLLSFDYDAILERKAPDVDLKDSDVVIVSTDGFKSFLKGFSGALNFGFFRLGKGF